ncbi:GCFC domain-containing protein [Meloidogyne graminicola]|uniref:GCFC domain-containing protein n=1 Tax=Meloidogyne graminicola TaxID=189291 RepID=A0A8T0A1P5_9BILA|nr:GCFC domain-containing protein [Meloidogyne graminicola]
MKIFINLRSKIKMFRKLKSKTGDNSVRNIRQRIDEEGVGGGDIQNKQTTTNYSDDIEYTLNVNNNEKTSTLLPKYNTGLSFNEDEGDDLTGFKLKKHGYRTNETNEKILRKQRLLAAKAERLKSTIEIEKIEDRTNGTENISRQQNIQEIEKLRQSESQNFSEEIISINSIEDVREVFPTSFDGIPDAKAVYEARKKREILRQVGASSTIGSNSGEFIPLDDTIRLKGNKQTGERSRLIREDENDISDEDEGGSFYSAKKLLQTEEDARREEQANFLSMEQGSSGEEENNGQKINGRKQRRKQTKKLNKNISDEEEEEDELRRWEHEQIRKGVSSNKVIQMRNELAATSLYFNENYTKLEKEGGGGEAEMDIEVDIEILNVQQQNIYQQQQQYSPSIPKFGNSSTIPDVTKPNTSFEQLLDNLNQRINGKKKYLEHSMPQLENKFKMFQNVRIYTRDLLDCLNEKYLQINDLEEKILDMWKQRTERLIKRRRQDVQDEYERCAANALGRSFIIPNPEFAQRETEREARRKRRKLQRSNIHFDGLSSDDEETQSQEVFYNETIVQKIYFLDTEDDFCQIQRIIVRIINWLVIDEDSFEKAYVSLCIPKLLGPFIRLQMINWIPLKNNLLLHCFPWYNQLLTAGLDNSGLESIEHPFIIQLIPNIVEKVIFPKIARIIREQWDPLSLTESTNLATLLRSLINDYPVANLNSKKMKEILECLNLRIRDVLENDTFVPLYSKDAIESVETGCAVFMDRQFWKSIKIMRSILCFRGILSDNFLEELVMEGLVNRCVVMSLQFAVITNPTTIPKCLALGAQIPIDWLPPKHYSSYRSLEVLFKQVIEVYKQRDRKFSEQMQNFVNLLSPIKKENVEEEEND